jgi:hypothetical protein
MANVATNQPNNISIAARDFFHKAELTANMLACRWADEKEYEDIKDYMVPLQKVASEFGVKITKMTKRPFGCHFEVDNKTFVLKCASRTYSYQRIA